MAAPILLGYTAKQLAIAVGALGAGGYAVSYTADEVSKAMGKAAIAAVVFMAVQKMMKK